MTLCALSSAPVPLAATSHAPCTVPLAHCTHHLAVALVCCTCYLAMPLSTHAPPCHALIDTCTASLYTLLLHLPPHCAFITIHAPRSCMHCSPCYKHDHDHSNNTLTMQLPPPPQCNTTITNHNCCRACIACNGLSWAIGTRLLFTSRLLSLFQSMTSYLAKYCLVLTRYFFMLLDPSVCFHPFPSPSGTFHSRHWNLLFPSVHF